MHLKLFSIATLLWSLTAAETDENVSVYFRIFSKETIDTCKAGIKIDIQKISSGRNYTCSCDNSTKENENLKEPIVCPTIGSRKLVIYSHGFLDSAEKYYGANKPNTEDSGLVRTLLKENDDVLLVDWSRHAKVGNLWGLYSFGDLTRAIAPTLKNLLMNAWNPTNKDNKCYDLERYSAYEDAAKNGVPAAAEEVAQLLLHQIGDRENATGFLDNVHLVGHSLGSHVMGQAGYKIQTKKDAKVNRITGLDPAAPHFHTKMTADNDLTKCLDKTDGKFVDVIHSNTQCFGMDEAVGHVDIYAARNKTNSKIISEGNSTSGGNEETENTDVPTKSPSLVERVLGFAGAIMGTVGWKENPLNRFRKFSTGSRLMEYKTRHALAIRVFQSSIAGCEEIYTKADKASKRGKAKSSSRLMRTEIRQIGQNIKEFHTEKPIMTIVAVKLENGSACIRNGHKRVKLGDSPKPEGQTGRGFGQDEYVIFDPKNPWAFADTDD